MAAFPFMPQDPRVYAGAIGALRCALEGSRALLEFNRAMFDLGRDNWRHQQDAMFEAVLRAVTLGPTPDGLMGGMAGFPDFGKASLAAMEAAAMTYRSATGALPWPPAPRAERPANLA